MKNKYMATLLALSILVTMLVTGTPTFASATVVFTLSRHIFFILNEPNIYI